MGFFSMAEASSTKHSICCEDDLCVAAYALCPRKEIMLWCDSRDGDEGSPKNKRCKTSDTMTKREETEQRVVEVAEELKEVHKDKRNLSEVQYHLWA